MRWAVLAPTPGSVCSCATDAELRLTGLAAVAFAFAALALFAPCVEAIDDWATPITVRMTIAARIRRIAVLQERVKKGAALPGFQAVRSGRLVYGTGCPRQSDTGQGRRHRTTAPGCAWKVLQRR